REVPAVESELRVLRSADVRDRRARAVVVEVAEFRRAAGTVVQVARLQPVYPIGRGRVDRRRDVVHAHCRTEFDDAWNVLMAGDVAMVRKIVQLGVRSDTGFEQDFLA